MQNKNKDIRIVYSMHYATQLQLLNHQVLKIIPNPKKPQFNCWVFKADPTFDSDFTSLKEESHV